jgi:uncharacterized metal-binding protein YceD (DUF177 family)
MSGSEAKLVYGSLKDGFHDLDYHLTADFFQNIDQSLIADGDVRVLLKVERSERQLSLDFKLEGWVEKSCDICLSRLEYPIKTQQFLHVKITDKEMDDEVDLIAVGSNEYELDLATHLFDYVALSLPMKLECKDSLNRETCDNEVLSMLSAEEEESDNSNHPEWKKLKEIFKN